jgi:proline iminopeptidase
MKKTLVLLHGGPGFDDSYFHPFFQSIKDEYIVLSYTIGANGADRNSIEGLVSELDVFIKENCIGEFSVYGHSFGGALGIEYFSKMKNTKAKKLILSNWVVDAKWIELFFKNYPEAAELEGIEDFRSSTLSYIDYYFLNKEKGIQVLENIQYCGEMYNNFRGYLGNMDLHDKLDALEVPLASISSEFDKITPDEYILNNARRHSINNFVIKNAGHFPFVDNPDDFFGNLIQILEGK